MKSYLVIGAGKKGSYLSRMINFLGYEVLVCDINEEKINDLIEFTTAQRIGDATNESFIESLDVSSFNSCFISISDNFESSLKCADLLKEKGARHVVAFASNEIQEKYLKLSGADAVVFGDKELANRVAIKYTNETIFDYFNLDDDGNAIMEIEVPSIWIGKSISELDIRKKYKINILGLKIGKKIKNIINPQFKFSKGERIVIFADKEALKLLIENKKTKINN